VGVAADQQPLARTPVITDLDDRDLVARVRALQLDVQPAVAVLEATGTA
jgi:hypothetical protein